MKLDIKEDKDDKMARFMSRFNRDIQDIAELYVWLFFFLEILVHQTIRVEIQLKRKYM